MSTDVERRPESRPPTGPSPAVISQRTPFCAPPRGRAAFCSIKRQTDGMCHINPAMGLGTQRVSRVPTCRVVDRA